MRAYTRPVPPEPAAGDQRKLVTLVFTDVTGSTALGEALDAEVLRAILRRYLDVSRRVLERHGGMVEKFVGDAVLAAFGMQQVHEDDALRALRAADELRTELQSLERELQAAHGVSIGVRFGVNSGEAVVGELAAGEGYATGDCVNVAARLEQAAAPWEILVGAATMALAGSAVHAELVGPVIAKGKSQPLEAYRLVSATTPAGQDVAAPDGALVGRERELAELSDAFEAARAGELGFAIVLGEAGIGKSRLAEELIGTLDDARVIRGRCLAYGDGITFWPVAEAIRSLAGVSAADSSASALTRLAQLPGANAHTATALAGMLGLDPAATPMLELFRAVRTVLSAAAGPRPLVVLLDDLQWAEPGLLDLVEYLAARLVEAPVLLLGLARPELEERRPGMVSLDRSRLLRLGPLAAPDVARLVEALLAVGGEHQAAQVAARSGGNPLFARELARLVDQPGGLAGYPLTLQAVLSARLDQLAPPERQLALQASVIGEVFSREAAAAIVDDAAAIGPLLHALARRGVVRVATESSDDAFRFGHALLRDVAYAGLPKASRATAHERLAEWMLARVADRLGEVDEIVGYHLEQAFRYRRELALGGNGTDELGRRAGELLAGTGRRASDRGDMHAAAELLSRAGALLEATDAERADVLSDLGLALWQGGRSTDSITVLRRALGLAEAQRDRRAEMRAAWGICWQQTPDLPEELGIAPLAGRAEALMDELEAAGDDRALAAAWNVIGARDHLGGQPDAARVSLRRALDHAQRGGASIDALITPLAIVTRNGELPFGVVLEELEELAAVAAGHALGLSTVRIMQAQSLAALDRPDEARAARDEGLALVEDLPATTAVALRHGVSSNLDVMLGDYEHAAREAQMAISVLEASGDLGHRAEALLGLAVIMARRGRPAEAEQALHEGRRLWVGASGDPEELAAQSSFAEGVIRASAGSLDEAARLFARAADDRTRNSPEYRAEALFELASVLAAQGDLDAAASAAARSADFYRRKQHLLGERAASELLRRLDTTPAPA